MIQKMGASETTFRIGFKILSILNGIPEKCENFQTIFKVILKRTFNFDIPRQIRIFNYLFRIDVQNVV